MLNPEIFVKDLLSQDINFVSGVPDSLLKNLLAAIDQSNKKGEISHVIAANEGQAISIAAGAYIATNRLPMVYLQNSGLGNALNPLTSLTNSRVYPIPILLVIGWRGEEGVPDEPQHEVMGNITREFLDLLEIKYFVVDKNSDTHSIIKLAASQARTTKTQVALLIKKDTFIETRNDYNTNNHEIEPQKAIESLTSTLDSKGVIFSTTGKLSRQLYEIRSKNSKKLVKEFLSVGSMGHILSIALGFSINNKSKKVYVFDGDGSALMHLGSFSVWANLFDSLHNFHYIIFINNCHDSVGGQPLSGGTGYDLTNSIKNLVPQLKSEDIFYIYNEKNLLEFSSTFSRDKFPKFTAIFVSNNKNSLPRPKETPSYYLDQLREFLNNDN